MALMQAPGARCAFEPAVATFGMGCFWGPQAAFLELNGVLSSTAGYASAINQSLPAGRPSYFSVCRGDGRTEAVRVQYDPSLVNYATLLRKFWEEHDASVVVPGKEDQYRSVIWAHDDEQQEMAERTVAEAAKQYASTGRAPATVVVPTGANRDFSPAETYHQNFWAKARAKFAGLALVQLLLLLGTQDDVAVPGLIGAAALAQQAILFWWFVESVELVLSAARGVLTKD
jgi:peptide-methionine (S)-S-oxide reductase